MKSLSHGGGKNISDVPVPSEVDLNLMGTPEALEVGGLSTNIFCFKSYIYRSALLLPKQSASFPLGEVEEKYL